MPRSKAAERVDYLMARSREDQSRDFIREHPKGVEISVYVQPRASKSEITGTRDAAVKIRLASAPVDGEANRELINLLSRKLKVKKADIKLKSGLKSRSKTVVVRGITARDAAGKLA